MDWDIWIPLIYIVVISLLSIVVTVYDKIAAIRKKRRISERNLLMLSVCGGSVAMYMTMLVIRHKTKHLKFMVGIPLIFVSQVLLFILIYTVV